MEENKQLIPAVGKQETEVEIDLLDLLNALKQHVLIIVLVTIAGALLGFLYTRFLVTPEFQSTSSIYVVSASSGSVLNLSELNLSSSLANDYKVLVKSRNMLNRVLKSTGDNLTAAKLKRMLSVNNESGTRIMNFTVTSTDPEQAYRLANAVAETAIEFLPEVMGDPDRVPQIVDTAVMPKNPSNVHTMRNIALGAIIGFLVIAAIYVVQYLLNDTFNSSEDVEKYLGIVPVAMVPENGQKHRGNGYYYYYYYSNNTKGRRRRSGSGKKGGAS